jgi:3-methyladenine DNA glycosylase AlkD
MIKVSSNKQLKKLNNKQILEDIKRFVKNHHEIYTPRLPDLKILAKRLHEEHDLENFYKVFNKLWKGSHEERLLSLYTLQLYKQDLNLKTWDFLKPKIKDIKSLDHADNLALVLGFIHLNYQTFDKEIVFLAKSHNLWSRRIALISLIPMIKEGKIDFAVTILPITLYAHDESTQKSNGIVLKELSIKNPEIAKRIILKEHNLPENTFMIATENLKELRKIKKFKKLDSNKFSILRIFPWKY